jgi:hypothetical protein
LVRSPKDAVGPKEADLGKDQRPRGFTGPGTRAAFVGSFAQENSLGSRRADPHESCKSASNLDQESRMAANDGDLVDRMAKKYSVSPGAVQVVLAALRRGGGRMAQFSHADFGGMSQWSPGMSMVGDMFNTQLKAKLDALCSDIAAYLDTPETAGGSRATGEEVSYRSPIRSDDWWPAGLGRPAAVGAQNDLRYAVFPETRRLVIDDQGTVSVYDTGSHRIFGVAQAQSADRTLTFTSQDGLVRIADLQRLSL